MISTYKVVILSAGVMSAGLWGALAAVVIVGLVMFAVISRQQLKSLKGPGVPMKSFISYRERFEKMEADADAKYGPSVELLRPVMEIDDDPELFDLAWKEFERDRKERLIKNAR